MRFKLAAALCLLASAAFGQGAQFPAGTVWGNDTAAQRPGKTATVTAILDRALGSTRGAILERGASGWAIVGPGATSGLPWVSNGVGADPAYQRLGLVGGGTNADLSATGGASQFLRQNSAGAAITVVQPNFTDLAGRGTLAQLPQGIANSIFINPTGSTANMQNIAVPACANDGLHALVYVNATGLLCATISAGVTSVNGQTGAISSYFPPQHRITLTSGTAITTSDVVSATAHFVTPSVGDMIPIYNGTNMVPTVFAETTQATSDTTKSPAAVAASSIYGIFCWIDTGPTNRCTRSAAWTNDTTPCATCGWTFVNGIALNTSSITNGPAAQRGTFMGIVRSNGSSQLMDSMNFRWVSNIYNTAPRPIQIVDVAVSWNYTTATFRQCHGAAAFQTDWIQALPGGQVNMALQGSFSNTTAGAAAVLGIDIDALNTSVVVNNVNNQQSIAANGATAGLAAFYNGFPGNGRHIGICKEFSSAVGTSTFNGSTGVSTTGIYGTVWN